MGTVRFSAGVPPKGPSAPGGERPVPARLVTPAPIPRPNWQKVLIVFVVLIVVGMVALMVSQPAMRSGPMGIMSMFFPVMLLVSTGGMIFGGRMSGGDNRQLTGGQLDVARKDYFNALDETGDVVQDAAQAQFEQAAFYHPEPALLCGLVGSDRMWERTRSAGVAVGGGAGGERSAEDLAAVHFGWVRMGVGRAGLAIKLVPEDQGDPADYEPATFEAERQFTLAQRAVAGIAKPISLRAHPGLGLVGSQGMEPVYGLVRAMVLQAAVFHSPQHVQVMVLTDDPQRWDWIKWLPHNQHTDAARADCGGSGRMVWTRLEDLSAEVGEELEHARGTYGASVEGPHWLVICDQARPGANWDPITRAKQGGVAGVTFVRLAAERGEGLEFSDRTTLFVTDSAIVDYRGEPFATPDCVDEATARTIARKMARFSVQGSARAGEGEAEGSQSPDLCEMLGIADARNPDLDLLWSKTVSPPRDKGPWDKAWGRFPFARDEYGQIVSLDFKETDKEGQGPHAIGIGTSGSGKSEFISTLLASMCLTHSPVAINVAFFDLKGSSTAHKIKDFPHVVAAVTDLQGDYLLERMAEGIKGEGVRRKRLLDQARVGDVYTYEEMRIHRGEDLEPLPWLFIIVDEFTQWFETRREEAKELTSWLSRQGRGLGMSMILLSQSLGHDMASGQDAMKNIPIRLTLRVLNENDSREIIGQPDAYHLPQDQKGAGYLKVIGTPRITGFQTAYVSKDYEPPAVLDVSGAEQAPEFVISPQLFTASQMRPLPAAVIAAAGEQVVEQAAPSEVLGPDGRPLKQIQALQDAVNRKFATMTYRPHAMWCPPLQAVAADELVARLRGKPWQQDYGCEDSKRLLFAVGVEDRPFNHAQLVYAPDVTDQSCIVPGRKGSGRTTVLTTMIVSAALTYSPRRVQFVVLGFSGADLNDVRKLPHVVSFARGSQRDRVVGSIREMKTLITARENAFLEGDFKLEDFREARFGEAGGPDLLPSDPFGDVFLVIDGWNSFRESYEDLLVDVENILSRGASHGVHMLISTDGYIPAKLTTTMTTAFGVNVELKLSKDDALVHNPNHDVAKAVPFGVQEAFDPDNADQQLGEIRRDTVRVTGRGRSMFGYHFQTGRPWLTVGTDQVPVSDPLAGELIDRVMGRSGAQVRLLPAQISRAQVWEKADLPRAGVVPFGISEDGFGAAVADFTRYPHLVFTGATKSGTSKGLATVAQGVMDVYGPDEAKLYVVSPDNALVQYVPEAYLGTYEALEPTPEGLRVPSGRVLAGYVSREQQIIDLDAYLGALLATRVRPDDVSQAEIAAGTRRWSGPEIFLLVDNEEDLEAWVAGPTAYNKSFALERVAGFIKSGHEVGLHVIVSRLINQWARINTSLMRQLQESRTPTVVMSGPRAEGKIVGEVFPKPMVPGRGTYFVNDDQCAAVQIALPDPAGTRSRWHQKEAFGD